MRQDAETAATPARAVLVECQDLTRRDAATGALLLDGVALALHAGERTALMGPSGVGKSVLLRALALLDAHDAGMVRWRGEPIARKDITRYRRDVTYVSQRPAMLEGTVEDNLRVPYALGVHRDERYDRQRVLALLATAGRDADFLHKTSHTLSGGEAQITALVRVIQTNPGVLLLDEPTAALDPESVRAVERMVDAWFGASAGERAVLWVTHDAAQAARIATRQASMTRQGLRAP